MIAPYYCHSGITIYNCDYRDVIEDIKCDILITDPPYDIVAAGGGIATKRKYLADIKGFTDMGFDESILDRFSNWMVFCSKNQLVSLLQRAAVRRWMLITWNKSNPTPLSNSNYLPDTEYVIHSFEPGRLFGEYKDKSRFILHPAQQKLFHPNQKPIKVMEKLVKIGSKENDMVLDLFAGSGSTLRVCKDLGRNAIGVEIQERYCEIAAKRLSQEVMALA